ncbi:hypothetical protein IE53DRAFT_386960 [Violaceomyces palustris]|uniref:Uncharacterized protein n=1 Tax=Violaceomyces palustris TaxID=1673888 RepID=A0ACD0NY74_9BASI|nr:hypothetical protein IE53DRAFT_386960 [Violaceomyces palustris]
MSTITVLGSGILGLTNAFELRRKGHKVVIVARDLPWDRFSQSFASPWAGANWCSFASKEEIDEQRWDAKTYQVWRNLESELSDQIIARLNFTELSPAERGKEDVWFSDLVDDFKILPKTTDELGKGSDFAITYTSFTISVPNYTEWLVSQLKSETPLEVPSCLKSSKWGPPVEFIRTSTLGSIRSAAELVPGCEVMINCTGLGSLDLEGVEDRNVHPIMGQTVLINVPSFRSQASSSYSSPCRCVMKVGKSPIKKETTTRKTKPGGDDGQQEEEEEEDGKQASYVIPRARTGQVILGGSFQVGKASPLTPDKALTERIIKSCSQLVPEILGPDGKVDIISENIGLRPARHGGARVEIGQSVVGLLDEQGGKTRQVGVVHSYGIGPAGYQASFGIAEQVVQLTEKLLKGRQPHVRHSKI